MFRLIWIFIGLAVLFSIPFLIWGTHWDWSSQDAVKWLRQYGRWGWLVALVLFMGDLFLPIPSTAVMSSLGLLYGPVWGGLIGGVGSVGSGIIAYGLCRLFGESAVEKLLGKKDQEKGKHALHEVWGLDGCSIPLASLAARGGIVYGRFPENAMAYICDGARVRSPADGIYVCDGRAPGVGSPCHFDDTERNRTTLALVGDWQENDDISRETKTLTQAVDNARFVEVIGGHLNFDAVSNRQADEPLAHLTRDVSQDNVLVCKFHPKHGAGQYSLHCAFQFYMFFHP